MEESIKKSLKEFKMQFLGKLLETYDIPGFFKIPAMIFWGFFSENYCWDLVGIPVFGKQSDN